MKERKENDWHLMADPETPEEVWLSACSQAGSQTTIDPTGNSKTARKSIRGRLAMIGFAAVVLPSLSAWLTCLYFNSAMAESAAVKEWKEVRLLIPDLAVFAALTIGDMMTCPVDDNSGRIIWRKNFSADAIKELKAARLMSEQEPTEEQLQMGVEYAKISCDIYSVEVLHAEYPHTARVIVKGTRTLEDNSAAFERATYIPDFLKTKKSGRVADFTLDMRVANLPDRDAFKITHVRFEPKREPLFSF